MKYPAHQYRDIRRRTLRKFKEEQDRIAGILNNGPKNEDDVRLMLTAMSLVATEAENEVLDFNPVVQDNVIHVEFNRA